MGDDTVLIASVTAGSIIVVIVIILIVVIIWKRKRKRARQSLEYLKDTNNAELTAVGVQNGADKKDQLSFPAPLADHSHGIVVACEKERGSTPLDNGTNTVHDNAEFGKDAASDTIKDNHMEKPCNMKDVPMDKTNITFLNALAKYGSVSDKVNPVKTISSDSVTETEEQHDNVRSAHQEGNRPAVSGPKHEPQKDESKSYGIDDTSITTSTSAYSSGKEDKCKTNAEDDYTIIEDDETLVQENDDLSKVNTDNVKDSSSSRSVTMEDKEKYDDHEYSDIEYTDYVAKDVTSDTDFLKAMKNENEPRPNSDYEYSCIEVEYYSTESQDGVRPDATAVINIDSTRNRTGNNKTKSADYEYPTMEDDYEFMTKNQVMKEVNDNTATVDIDTAADEGDYSTVVDMGFSHKKDTEPTSQHIYAKLHEEIKNLENPYDSLLYSGKEAKLPKSLSDPAHSEKTASKTPQYSLTEPTPEVSTNQNNEDVIEIIDIAPSANQPLQAD